MRELVGTVPQCCVVLALTLTHCTLVLTRVVYNPLRDMGVRDIKIFSMSSAHTKREVPLFVYLTPLFDPIILLAS